MGDCIEREKLFKIMVVGDIGVGKTCLIKRFVHNIFFPYYKSTIGVDFAIKILNWSDKLTIKLQLWDIAGQERFKNMTRHYYKDSMGALIVLDISRVPDTFEGAKKWKEDIDQKVSFMDTEDHIPVLLIVNKMDQIDIESEEESNMWTEFKKELDKTVKEYDFVGWVATSAKDGMYIENGENRNMNDFANKLVVEILQREAELNKGEEDYLSVIDDNITIKTNNDETSGCCS